MPNRKRCENITTNKKGIELLYVDEISYLQLTVIIVPTFVLRLGQRVFNAEVTVRLARVSESYKRLAGLDCNGRDTAHWQDTSA